MKKDMRYIKKNTQLYGFNQWLTILDGMLVFGVVLCWYAIALFQRVKNKVPLSKDVIFIFSGFAFFVPYLMIDVLRDTFAYYMIYFLPVMAVGLITIIYKIPNKTMRFLVFTSFLLAIIGNFLYVFPMWGF